jgi:hypothetical protein
MAFSVPEAISCHGPKDTFSAVKVVPTKQGKHSIIRRLRKRRLSLNQPARIMRSALVE